MLVRMTQGAQRVLDEALELTSDEQRRSMEHGQRARSDEFAGSRHMPICRQQNLFIAWGSSGPAKAAAGGRCRQTGGWRRRSNSSLHNSTNRHPAVTGTSALRLASCRPFLGNSKAAESQELAGRYATGAPSGRRRISLRWPLLPNRCVRTGWPHGGERSISLHLPLLPNRCARTGWPTVANAASASTCPSYLIALYELAGPTVANAASASTCPSYLIAVYELAGITVANAASTSTGFFYRESDAANQRYRPCHFLPTRRIS
jgi:hypothetical protein